MNKPYRLCVTTPGNKFSNAFANYVKTYEINNALTDDEKFWADAEKLWKMKNLPITPFVEFETEADATAFLLRWA